MVVHHLNFRYQLRPYALTNNNSWHHVVSGSFSMRRTRRGRCLPPRNYFSFVCVTCRRFLCMHCRHNSLPIGTTIPCSLTQIFSMVVIVILCFLFWCMMSGANESFDYSSLSHSLAYELYHCLICLLSWC